MNEIPSYFLPLVELLTKYLDEKVDYFTLQTYGGGYIDGPYVQALHEHDNYLLVEATSNEFLSPNLDAIGHQKMIFMGWRFYPERYLPNYAQFLDLSKVSSSEIATLLVRTLHFAYGVDHTFHFEIGPKLTVPLEDLKELEKFNVG